MTFNRRVREGIQDGTIKEVEQNGIRIYLVRPPEPGEVVMEYTNFSTVFGERTATDDAMLKD